MKRRLLIWLLLLCALCLCAADTLAVENGRKGSITVTLRTGEEPVAGGMLALHYIGPKLDMEPTPEYALVVERQLQSDPGIRCRLGENGCAVFAELKMGVYLVSQPSVAAGYRKMHPFLVSIPMLQDEVWNYDICAYPKTEKLPEDPEMPDTGQDLWPFCVLLLSTSGLLASAVLSRRTKNEDPDIQ